MKGRWLCGMQRTVATMPLIGRNIKDWDIPPPPPNKNQSVDQYALSIWDTLYRELQALTD